MWINAKAHSHAVTACRMSRPCEWLHAVAHLLSAWLHALAHSMPCDCDCFAGHSICVWLHAVTHDLCVNAYRCLCLYYANKEFSKLLLWQEGKELKWGPLRGGLLQLFRRKSYKHIAGLCMYQHMYSRITLYLCIFINIHLSVFGGCMWVGY